ncbi:MAG TPA: hypothetical protein VFV67_18610 [Actinophytocola sp.]|uniref:hypothetical protein n=1 Tax=Actinophytocola sp. TaxID=1872138 RepID=UPI002DB5D772|nr:hypothetical protein [Actinophytocola sp.]HEU5472663.1 hypothetical protein [Actinophytocola sp.]
MTELDAARGRLRLTTAELADPGAVAVSPRWARELLDVVARPGLRMTVRIVRPGPPLWHGVWATRRDAVLGSPVGAGRYELSPLEPVLIPFAVATIVGLRRRPVDPARTATRIPTSRYLALGDEPPGGEYAGLAAVLRGRRTAWRASSTWRDSGGEPHAARVHVIDGGDAGLWLVAPKDQDGPDPVLVVEPTDVRQVWSALTGLLGRRVRPDAERV